MKKYEHILVALERTEFDEQLLNRTKNLAMKVHARKITLVHMLPSVFTSKQAVLATAEQSVETSPYSAFQKALIEENVRSMELTNVADVEICTREIQDKPHRALLSMARDLAPDLIVIGKHAFPKGSGIMAKRLVRHFRGDLLMIPDDTHLKVDQIMVGIDFSTFSWQALSRAIDVNRDFGIPSPVVAVHAVDVPRRPAGMKEEVFNSLLDDMDMNAVEAMERFGYTYGFSQEDVQTETVLAKDNNITSALLKKAKQLGADIIAIGGKGESIVENDPFGSVLENMMDFCNDHALLIVQ